MAGAANLLARLHMRVDSTVAVAITRIFPSPELSAIERMVPCIGVGRKMGRITAPAAKRGRSILKKRCSAAPPDIRAARTMGASAKMRAHARIPAEMMIMGSDAGIYLQIAFDVHH
jgi:hypothetical protein